MNNSNSIFIYIRAKSEKYPFLQRSLDNKVLYQKSMDSKILKNNLNNYNSLKHLNLKDYKFSNLRFNKESLDNNNNIYKIKKINRNNLLFSFQMKKKERNYQLKKNKWRKKIYRLN